LVYKICSTICFHLKVVVPFFLSTKWTAKNIVKNLFHSLGSVCTLVRFPSTTWVIFQQHRVERPHQWWNRPHCKKNREDIVAKSNSKHTEHYTVEQKSKEIAINSHSKFKKLLHCVIDMEHILSFTAQLLETFYASIKLRLVADRLGLSCPQNSVLSNPVKALNQSRGRRLSLFFNDTSIVKITLFVVKLHGLIYTQ
jgi:hypothetical protein